MKSRGSRSTASMYSKKIVISKSAATSSKRKYNVCNTSILIF